MNNEFTIVNGKNGTTVETDVFWGQVAKAKAVCLGEKHDNPKHHWAQWFVAQNQMTKTSIIAMEMFQKPFQGVVDDYTQGKIDVEQLQGRTGWEENWGYPFEFYRPLIELGKDEGAGVLAINAKRSLVKRVAKVGLDGLTDTEKEELPKQIDRNLLQHRQWFEALMAKMAEAHGGGHGHGHSESFYQAQVLWDEAMADTTAEWLKETADSRAFVIAGSGHCHRWAIPARLEARTISGVLSVLIVEESSDEIASAISQGLYDYLFVIQQ